MPCSSLLLFSFLSFFPFLYSHVLHARALSCMTVNGGGSSCLPFGHDYRMISSVSNSPNSINSHVNIHSRISLKVGIKQKNLHRLEEVLLDVSDPMSENYGKHWTLEQVKNEFHDEVAARLVEEWMREAGVKTTVANHGNFVVAEVEVMDAERMLNTTFYYFESISTKKKVVRAFEYSLPEHLLDSIDYIADVVTFPPISKHVSSAFVAFNSLGKTGTVGPSTLSCHYLINDTDASGTTNGVFEVEGQGYSSSDASTFFDYANIAISADSFISFSGNIEFDPLACLFFAANCGESMLDVEYLMSLAQEAQTTYYLYSEHSTFADFLVDVSKQSNPPSVISISYGEPECPLLSAVQLQTVSGDMLNYYNADCSHVQTSFNLEAAKLGIRGVTLVVASGDDGANVNSARYNSSLCGTWPMFPASSPYVVAVGATQGPESQNSEVVCSAATNGQITSGGGFSNFFGMPSWQQSAVSSYLQQATLPTTFTFNATGRAYPDISLMGYNYGVVLGGNLVGESGTSASAPVFAAMLTLINANRLKSNKSVLGFLNPQLYRLQNNSKVFNDIISGNNDCATFNYDVSAAFCCGDNVGYPAMTGWDASSGLGSVNYIYLLAALNGESTNFDYTYNGKYSCTQPTSTNWMFITFLVVGCVAGTLLLCALYNYGCRSRPEIHAVQYSSPNYYPAPVASAPYSQL